MRKKIAATLAAGALTVTMAAGAVVTGAGTASAGTNGQQIHFVDLYGKTQSIHIEGPNQNGQWTALCVNTPSEHKYVDGWWWKGNITFTHYAFSDCQFQYQSQKVEYVAPYLPNTDYFLTTNR
ncbi:hypothetical protein [Embleya hyalina]|uniref:Secreted protein n=1 Tax=Embleya hyalina TaxID=516124 RepID=A0A401YQA9_9ACTN|nr:hypothetical protein [Embleya hyalina]GCD96788.1 hypothetical protein EHYA_04475 [Embleya hyalina]